MNGVEVESCCNRGGDDGMTSSFVRGFLFSRRIGTVGRKGLGDIEERWFVVPYAAPFHPQEQSGVVWMWICGVMEDRGR